MSEHANLAAALVAALAECSVVDKGRKAKIDGKDGKRGYEYEYADLGDVVKLTRPKLAEQGIVALTPIVDNGKDLQVTVVLLHASGEKLEFGPFSFPHGNTAQATGSMVTYYRRYALVSALGIAAGDDDDGATAQARQEPAQVIDNSARASELQDRIALLPEGAQTKILNWFKAPVGEWASCSDEALDKLAEQIGKAEQVAPATAVQEEPTVPGPDAPPAPAEPLTAAERAAARGTKKALGAVKNDQPRGVEGFVEAFPGAEEVAS